MRKDFIGSGLDIQSQKCKKCEFTTYSEGLLRQHKVMIHDCKETKQNVILGFESDMQRYKKVLESMEEGLEKFKCEECRFSCHSDGKLTLHNLTTHQG